MQGAALYGEQGVNGVIIVTTVKGKEKGKITVNVNSAVDFESVSFMPKTQQKYGQGWDGVHYPEENGSWEFLMTEYYAQQVYHKPTDLNCNNLTPS
jgi:hypothetical protein